ncbi:DUF5708 family protein [Streptomyces sp. HSW2009]|uniref:DUF5708 family protein n=1 Tax=Streptomyces sp. HSW2009 TaxID=3142890 RepID=UPI0032EE5739
MRDVSEGAVRGGAGGRLRPGTRHLLEGAGMLVVGAALWLFTGGVDTPVITLRKVGVVLTFLGAGQLLYAGYGAWRGKG